MSTFIVPPIEGDGEWPTLGGELAAWQEATLAFGPGDLLGRPYRVDEEGHALLEMLYQVYPPQHRGRCRFDSDGASWRCTVGNGRCGRRRFQTGALVQRKGSLKSERLAAVASGELAPDAPVRCDGFRREGRTWIPIGRPVVSPFVFIFAFAKEQAEDTSFDAMRAMIEQGPGADRFEVYEERILRRGGDGEAKAMATAPDSKDGGKTTFQGKEETHRWVLPRQKEAHQTTRANLSKRPLAEPWELHATTMYAPGEQSVLEDMHDGVRKLTGEQRRGSRIFFFYRFADPKIQIRDKDDRFIEAELRRAIVDASGPVIASWSDVDDIATRQFLSDEADPDYAERVWLNRSKQRTEVAFDSEAWKSKANRRAGQEIPKGAQVVGGFDGSRGTTVPGRSPDHTGLIVTEIATGLQVKFGHWDPQLYPDGQIQRDQVDVAVDEMFTTFDVWRLYADPPDWDSEISAWVGKYGKERVIPWYTWRERAMGFATGNYAQAITAGDVLNDGDADLEAHIGHARRRFVTARNDKGEKLWTVQKERPGSLLKIDLAVAGIISWEARNDAIAAGILNADPEAYAGLTTDEVLERMRL